MNYQILVGRNGEPSRYLLVDPEAHRSRIRGYTARSPHGAIDTGGLISLEPGLIWDGPSGPALNTTDFMRASLFHDWLYGCFRSGRLPGHLRGEADYLMRKIAEADGMGRTRRWYAWLGVRIFGGWWNRSG